MDISDTLGPMDKTKRLTEHLVISSGIAVCGWVCCKNKSERNRLRCARKCETVWVHNSTIILVCYESNLSTLTLTQCKILFKSLNYHKCLLIYQLRYQSFTPSNLVQTPKIMGIKAPSPSFKGDQLNLLPSMIAWTFMTTFP